MNTRTPTRFTSSLPPLHRGDHVYVCANRPHKHITRASVERVIGDVLLVMGLRGVLMGQIWPVSRSRADLDHKQLWDRLSRARAFYEPASLYLEPKSPPTPGAT